MPHTESAKKRLRQNEARRVRNKARTTELKTLHKQVLRAHHDGKAADVERLSRLLTKRLDQAASARAIHRNAASRSKARLALALAKPPAPAKGDKAAAAKADKPKA